MDEDEDKGRSIGRGMLALVAVVAIIVVCAVGYLVGERAVPQTNAYNVAPANVSVDLDADNGAIPTYSGPAPSEQPVNAAVPVAPAQPSTPAPVASDTLEGSVASDDAPTDSAPNIAAPASDADQQGRQEIGDAIQDATQQALDRGGNVRWHKDGLSGFAIASGAVTSAGRTCRNAYATTVRDGGETRTPTTRWCRSGDSGPWAAQ